VSPAAASLSAARRHALRVAHSAAPTVAMIAADARYGYCRFRPYSAPAAIGPRIRPAESNESMIPIAAPWPRFVRFEIKEAFVGRMI